MPETCWIENWYRGDHTNMRSGGTKHTGSAIVFDLDNTLYDFDTYFVRSFRAMVRVVLPRLDVSEAHLLEDFRSVYGELGSFESMEAIAALRALREPEISGALADEIVKVGKRAFEQAGARHLRLYPGVRETLQIVKQAGIRLFVLSDAPRVHAIDRLRRLRLLEYFDSIFTWEGIVAPEPAADATPQDKDGNVIGTPKPAADLFSWAGLTLHDDEKIIGIPKEHKKPNPTVLRSIVDTYGLHAKSTVLVGDSVDRDIRVAKSAGVVSVWARYGARSPNLDTVELLTKLLPWEEESRRREQAARDTINPDYIIDRVDGIRELFLPANTEQLLPL